MRDLFWCLIKRICSNLSINILSGFVVILSAQHYANKYIQFRMPIAAFGKEVVY